MTSSLGIQQARFDEAKAEGTRLGLEAVRIMGERYHGEADCTAVFVAMVLGLVLGGALGELGLDDAMLIWASLADQVRNARVADPTQTRTH
ncbi:MAG: hypothetical protein GAK28_00714 [Luteibacter sp.]|uniref:hypothetical protein n=1 Tax=Luteibacter sp. TaxID=1886636 RepID=UPI0013861871|nr:hypothetical protein [Luteibacter sp.]KAF1009081.1 MAG: hypothetical protein GAK28_00714 [Luteibacter sp.]